MICIADKNNFIKGFKFNQEYIKIIGSRWKEGLYRYKKSKKERAFFRVRLYCVIVLLIILKEIKNKKISLKICRDFDGHERDIDKTLKDLLGKNGFIVEHITHEKLDDKSNAHNYAYLMNKDKKDLMRNNYVKISIEEIEKFLKK